MRPAPGPREGGRRQEKAGERRQEKAGERRQEGGGRRQGRELRIHTGF